MMIYDGKYVLCFNLPPKDEMKKDGVQSDITSLSIKKGTENVITIEKKDAQSGIAGISVEEPPSVHHRGGMAALHSRGPILQQTWTVRALRPLAAGNSFPQARTPCTSLQTTIYHQPNRQCSP